MGNTILLFGGLFNITDPFFGLQIYIWLWIFLTFCAICLWLVFRYGVWEKYKPLWGIWYAFKASSYAACVFDAKLNAEILSEAASKCIFNYAENVYEGFSDNRVVAWFERRVFNYASVYLDEKELPWAHAVLYKFAKRNLDVEIAKKLQNYEWDAKPPVNVCGTGMDLILDADRWTIPNSPQHRQIEAYCEIWNEGNTDDQIHSYSKFARYIEEGKITDCPSLSHVTPSIVIPWTRIDDSFPIDIEDNEQAGARRQNAEDEANAEDNQYNKYIPTILAGGFGAFIFILIARGVMIFMAAKPA